MLGLTDTCFAALLFFPDFAFTFSRIKIWLRRITLQVDIFLLTQWKQWDAAVLLEDSRRCGTRTLIPRFCLVLVTAGRRHLKV